MNDYRAGQIKCKNWKTGLLASGRAVLLLCFLMMLLALASPQASAEQPGNHHRTSPARTAAGHAGHREVIGRASWYGPGFNGHLTASGERFSSRKMTAASRKLPMGAHVVITNLRNGRSAKVRVNDCGPFVSGRTIDLSRKAARKIGMIHHGVTPVRIKVVEVPFDAEWCHS